MVKFFKFLNWWAGLSLALPLVSLSSRELSLPIASASRAASGLRHRARALLPGGPLCPACAARHTSLRCAPSVRLQPHRSGGRLLVQVSSRPPRRALPPVFASQQRSPFV